MPSTVFEPYATENVRAWKFDELTLFRALRSVADDENCPNARDIDQRYPLYVRIVGHLRVQGPSSTRESA